MEVKIPKNLKRYVKIQGEEIILKKEIPQIFQLEYEEFKHAVEIIKAISKEMKKKVELTEIEKEFRMYCKLYEEKFHKIVHIPEPGGTMENSIALMKKCLELGKDDYDKIIEEKYNKLPKGAML